MLIAETPNQEHLVDGYGVIVNMQKSNQIAKVGEGDRREGQEIVCFIFYSSFIKYYD